jgi:hypothetical protein
VTETEPEPKGNLPLPPPIARVNAYFNPSLRISIRSKFASEKAKHTLHLAEVYINGLIVQWNRISEDMDALNFLTFKENPLSSAEDKNAWWQFHQRYSLDIHFYLICWDQIEKHLDSFVEAQGDPALAVIRIRIGEHLTKGSRARNFLEHLDKQATETPIGIRGSTISGDGGFLFEYVDESKRGKYPKDASLGRAEVLEVLNAYSDILRQLGVDPKDIRAYT